MADDNTQRGRRDRERVAADEPHEVDYLAKKFGMPALLVRQVIEEEGPMREDVERHLIEIQQSGARVLAARDRARHVPVTWRRMTVPWRA